MEIDPSLFHALFLMRTPSLIPPPPNDVIKMAHSFPLKNFFIFFCYKVQFCNNYEDFLLKSSGFSCKISL